MTNKERYYSLSLLKSLAYDDDVNGNCDGMIDFTVIDSIGGADVEKVRHGEWLPNEFETSHQQLFNGVQHITIQRCVPINYRCSECGRIEEYKELYCNCGAKMDAKES